MTRAGNGTCNGPGFPGAVVLAPPVLAADDRPMLLNASPRCVADSAGAPPDAAAAPAAPVARLHVPVAVPASASGAEPLRGRALLARLEQVAQVELAQLAAHAEPTLPTSVNPALAGLAWDLGLSGDAAAALTDATRPHPPHQPIRPIMPR